MYIHTYIERERLPTRLALPACIALCVEALLVVEEEIEEELIHPTSTSKLKVDNKSRERERVREIGERDWGERVKLNREIMIKIYT